MDQLFYRFRKVENLLGPYKELENQSIFFASPEDLNDPMEGFSDIYWSGDKIVWENLFRNYVICLEHIYAQHCIGGGELSEITANDILPNLNIDDYPTPMYKQLVTEIIEDFFNDNIRLLIDKIQSRTTYIKQEELHFYLQSIHYYALLTIIRKYQSKGLIGFEKEILQDDFYNDSIKRINDEIIENIENLIKELGEEAVSHLFGTYLRTNSQMDLLVEYNKIHPNLKNLKNFKFIFYSFTENYLRRLETLCCPDWYTACFMTESENSSVWGNYGENHTGVCLIFKPELDGDKYNLPLKSFTGYTQYKDEKPIPNYDLRRFQLYPIDYESEFLSFNFFTNLGQLNRPTLSKMWLSNSKGEHSNCATEIREDIEKWRKKYWDNFIKRNTIKSKDWSYENEYRLILNGNFHDFTDKKLRTLYYDFESLVGLIFGISTKDEDKLKIMNIIEKKCRESKRSDFNFYQAYYSPRDKCIKHLPLSLLKFKEESTE
ncbi:DUF2971 domain-containing protein [Acinetobacter sp. CWB-B33]|uniref:DUF2971 domain-containing protein n=1 Tax=Acinetobacter sp. CWB-B33 TaxID=2815724 RepID=UPI0031FE9EE9